MRRPSPRARRLVGAALAGTLFLASAPPAFALPGDPAPDATTPAAAFAPEAVKAAYLVNFVRFTEWPAGRPASDAPYVIGISGNRPLEDELIRLADRQLVRGHRLRIVRLRALHDLEDVHLAYFESAAESATEAISADEALPFLRRHPVLTVSDSPGFLPLGGVVNFYRDGAALRFEVSPGAAREA